MPAITSEILHYLNALRRKWVGFVTGSTVTAFFEWLAFRGTPIPEVLWKAFLFGGIPVAGFLAWREQYRTLTSKPRLRIRVSSQPDFPGDDPRTAHRLIVHNDGPGAAETVRVSIVGREPAEPVGAYDNFPYHVRDGGGGIAGCTINPGTEDFFQLAKSWRSGDQRRIVEGLNGIEEPPDRYRRVAMPDGAQWRLRLIVSGSNVDTQQVAVLVRAVENKQIIMCMERT
ncbi:MAG TPA: hypothetical protein VEO73_04935 [Gemmatimonadales bacterium]|nr:hypothetical protein [Gemmatimonadales bacterium]